MRYTLPAAALLLGACAAALPGYAPPPLKERKSTKAIVPSSGEMTGEGTYELSELDKARDCKRTLGSMQITIARLKDPGFRVEPSAVASAMQSGSANLAGGSARGADRQAEYARERARLEAYNRLLASKNCKTMDIDAELAKPPEQGGKRY
ncbi:MAG TPA: hypothetical protein VN523_09500 [Hyphomicrobiaceae bacterium]|nr:hypothetical protein [Hyphomicrobiaceae bacterium]